MSKPQFIRTESGEELVVLTRRDYIALRARAGEEAAEDEMTAQLVDDALTAQKRGEDVALPEVVWAAIEAGEPAIKVLRRHRALTQASLAEAAGVSQGFIADIEAGRKQGAPSTLKAIAHVLGVPLDLLVG